MKMQELKKYAEELGIVEIPKPFSRIYVKYMKPIFVPRNTAKEDLETYRMQVQTSLE